MVRTRLLLSLFGCIDTTVEKDRRFKEHFGLVTKRRFSFSRPQTRGRTDEETLLCQHFFFAGIKNKAGQINAGLGKCIGPWQLGTAMSARQVEGLPWTIETSLQVLYVYSVLADLNYRDQHRLLLVILEGDCHQ